ncbi:MAG: nodulation protein NfeD [Candidatus Omnitrophota bacterium]|nr:MAG: nodulation protein NfeD [Candidatus Omnitrophota bacterium]
MMKPRTLVFFVSIIVCLGLPASFAQTRIKLLTIQEDIINPVTSAYIERGLKAAENDNALLIIKMDTPGGLLKSTEKIVKHILNSPIPVVTYIYPRGGRAASAGVFIGYASHILAMSPSTHIGAAHPVIGGGRWGTLGEETKKKIVNDATAWAKNISHTQGRPFAFIKDAIEKSISITEKEAIKRGVCDLVADSLDELIQKMDGRTVTTSTGKITISTREFALEEINLTQREKFLNILIEPNIAYLLLTLGFLGLIFEVTHPGFGFPGIAGIICLILAFYAFSVLPINYAGLTLIILGLLFFVVEAFTPTFGMFTLGGVIAFIFGSVMLFNQRETIKVSFAAIVPVALFFSALSIFFITRTVMMARKKSFTGAEGLLGKVGIAQTDIARTGKVFIHGEIWNATAHAKIKKGQEVIVEKIEGLKLIVQKKEEK